MRQHLRLSVTPAADPANVVTGHCVDAPPGDAAYRFTVLDDGLVRLEHSATGVFEDRASQLVVDRAFPPVDFTVAETDDRLEIRTSRLHLVYDKRDFSAVGLSVQSVDPRGGHTGTWRFGERPGNLGGTARTLDEVDGALPLEDGLLSRAGIAVVDDSGTVLLDDDGWIAERTPGNVDLYAFGFGRDYRAALAAFYRLTGPQPLLPRFALGNWWSRFYAYSDRDYLDLLDRFAAERVPLAVAVIDMDWHLVDIDPALGTGWTGYTWNRGLFPDPPAFLAELHRRGLAVTLNVHPADGVRRHEEAYERVARRLGVDPDSGLPVAFDPTDPDFLDAYLEELHHPLEAQGVDFWWLDWQQGVRTRIAGLDPLWLLNHIHFLDSGREGGLPLTFSRYAGLGSHRYPVGFSGDTHITWESLDFQPYFTATASNAGYGWWSHDIGGHFFGYRDDELTVRWVQLGVLSPIMRLHAGSGPFNGKEPWRYGEVAHRVIEEWLRLRHRLVPYLHTMNHRAHDAGEPLVQPMYYDHPETDAAYDVPNQFMFGSDLLVAPITTPVDRSTGLGTVAAWLPEGDWVDLLTGLTYRAGPGGRRLHLHRPLEGVPLLARAGALVPLLPQDHALDPVGANPPEVELRVHAGADGSAVLVEDDGTGRPEGVVRTPLSYDESTGEVVVGPAEGAVDAVPATRTWHLVACGFAALDGAEVDRGQGFEPVELGGGPVPGGRTVTVADLPAAATLRVRLYGDRRLADNDASGRVFAVLDAAQLPFDLKHAAYDVVLRADSPVAAVAGLVALDLTPHLLSALTELLTAR